MCKTHVKLLVCSMKKQYAIGPNWIRRHPTKLVYAGSSPVSRTRFNGLCFLWEGRHTVYVSVEGSNPL